MEKQWLVELTDCRGCVHFYGYYCNLQLGKDHIWDYCEKFKPKED